MIFGRKIKKYKNIDSGFVMLYAILFVTVILSIGITLLSVLIEQVPISGLERESNLSFNATDSGMECALYWDSDTTTLPEGSFRALKPLASMPCNGAGLVQTTFPQYYASGSPSGGFRTDTYTFVANFPQGTCAKVVVSKLVTHPANQVSTTTVESRGYNTACPPSASAKAWRLERGLRSTY